MKKYMIMMLACIGFQSGLYCSQVNKAIEPELRSAQLGINIPIPLDLDVILQALLSSAQQPGSFKKHLAVFHLQAIKKGLENFKAKQYPNYFLSWFVATPDIVKNQIQPALDKVNNALSSLNSNQNNNSYAIAGAVVGSLALVGGAVAGVAVYNKYRSRQQPESGLDAAVSGDSAADGGSASVLGEDSGRRDAMQPQEFILDTAVDKGVQGTEGVAEAERVLAPGEDSDRRSSVGSTNSTATPSVGSDDGRPVYQADELSSDGSISPHQGRPVINVFGADRETAEEFGDFVRAVDPISAHHQPLPPSPAGSDGDTVFGETPGEFPEIPQPPLPVSANYKQALRALQESALPDSAMASTGHVVDDVSLGVSLHRDEEPRPTIVVPFDIDEARAVLQQSAIDPKPLSGKKLLDAKELVGILLDEGSFDAVIKEKLTSKYGIQDCQAKEIIDTVKLERKLDYRYHR